MTESRLSTRTSGRHDKLERRKAGVLADIISGESESTVAKRYKVSVSSVAGFKRRYAAVIAQMRGEIEQRAEEYAIALKVNRIAAKDRRWQLLEALRQARANGQSGHETGLLVKTYRKVGHGEDAELVEEYRVDADMLAAMERAERSAAEELGQLPSQQRERGGDSYVYVDQSKQAVNFFDRSQALALAQSLLEAKGLTGNSRRVGYGDPNYGRGENGNSPHSPREGDGVEGESDSPPEQSG